MLKEFKDAKLKIAEGQHAKIEKQEFLSFIEETRTSLTRLLSPLKQLDINHDYGSVFAVPVEGRFINNIDPMFDLHIPNSTDYSMDIFIGRETTGDWINAWNISRRHRKPHMVVDVAVQHKPSYETATHKVYIIQEDAIQFWDKGNGKKAEVLPPGQSEHTKLIKGVIQYTMKHPELFKE